MRKFIQYNFNQRPFDRSTRKKYTYEGTLLLFIFCSKNGSNYLLKVISLRNHRKTIPKRKPNYTSKKIQATKI